MRVAGLVSICVLMNAGCTGGIGPAEDFEDGESSRESEKFRESERFDESGRLITATRAAILVTEARRESSFLDAATSCYSATTYMNEQTGTRRADCSGFVGYAVRRVLPDAYALVARSTTVFKPLAIDWYNYLASCSSSPSTETTAHFRRILDARDLGPGDLLVWLQPATADSDATGHIMVVDGYPRVGRTDKSEILLPVIDSTRAPHAGDSRGTTADGIGSGTIGLNVDNSGHPIAYYWRGGVSTLANTTEIAMGRVE